MRKKKNQEVESLEREERLGSEEYYDVPKDTQTRESSRASAPEKYEKRKENSFDRHQYAKESVKKSKERHKEQNKEKQSRNVSGIVLTALQVITSIVFVVLLSIVNILPTRYLIVIIIALVLLLLFTLITQFYRNGRPVGKAFALLVSVILICGSVYIGKAYSVLNKVTGGGNVTVKQNEISFIVMKESPLESQDDLAGCTIAYAKTQGKAGSEKAIKDLNDHLASNVKTKEYMSYNEAIQALYDKTVDALVFDESFRSIITEQRPTFGDDTRKLGSFTYEEEVSQSQTRDIKIDSEPFNVYLSGNDEWGEVTIGSGRSDVNIIATVNPATKTILLTTTPRDYYIPLAFSDGTTGDEYLDKLTHSGVYGMDCSMATLEELYDIELDYYVRLNFSGFQGIVDALGGIDVNSEYAFTTTDGSTSYVKGINHLDGYEALLFVRERKAFSNGDLQRGKNQMLMIKAMVKKIMSPAILTNYMQLMDEVSNCFITDMPMNKITDLVKYQLSNNTEWTVITNSVTGYGATRGTYSMGWNLGLSVIEPDQASVQQAKQLIINVMNGVKVSQPKDNTTIEVNPYSPSNEVENETYVPSIEEPTQPQTEPGEAEPIYPEETSGGTYDPTYTEESSTPSEELSSEMSSESGIESGVDSGDSTVDPGTGESSDPGAETSSTDPQTSTPAESSQPAEGNAAE